MTKARFGRCGESLQGYPEVCGGQGWLLGRCPSVSNLTVVKQTIRNHLFMLLINRLYHSLSTTNEAVRRVSFVWQCDSHGPIFL